jgi:hypothetical protein
LPVDDELGSIGRRESQEIKCGARRLIQPSIIKVRQLKLWFKSITLNFKQYLQVLYSNTKTRQPWTREGKHIDHRHRKATTRRLGDTVPRPHFLLGHQLRQPDIRPSLLNNQWIAISLPPANMVLLQVLIRGHALLRKLKHKIQD